MKRHTAGEDYLKTILILQKEKGTVRSVDVAVRLNVSKPSVSYAVAVLKESDLISVDENMNLHLTQSGQVIAEQVYRRHCFFKDLLMDSGVSKEQAEEDACRMEHAIAEDSFQKLKKHIYEDLHPDLKSCSSF